MLKADNPSLTGWTDGEFPIVGGGFLGNGNFTNLNFRPKKHQSVTIQCVKKV